MALPSLPEDIICTNILPRLGAKTVTRFRSVCKSWNSLILEPDFAKHHLYFTTQNPDDDYLIFKKNLYAHDDFDCMKDGYDDIAVLSLSDLSETRLIDVPPSSKNIEILGSINGVVCLYLYELDQFIVWNPAIRRAMKIKSPIRQFMLRDVTRKFLGFCWDAVGNDFKVVSSYYQTEQYPTTPLSLYVYSCNLGSWSLPCTSTFLEYDGTEVWWVGDDELPSAIVTRVPYWTCSLYPGSQRLFKFDIGSKDFSMLPKLYFDRKKHVIVVNLKECLSALAYDGASVDVHCFDERCGVWRKKYSVGLESGDLLSRGWSKIHNVRRGSVLGCFKYGGEIVFSVKAGVDANSTIYRCYDHKTNKITDLHNQKGYTKKCFSYKASLIFVKGMKPQHQIEPTLWKH